MEEQANKPHTRPLTVHTFAHTHKTDRDALKLAHEEWAGPPAVVRVAVAAGAALAAAGAAAVAGTLRPISPAANQK
jgi:hypothetical protein